MTQYGMCSFYYNKKSVETTFSGSKRPIYDENFDSSGTSSDDEKETPEQLWHRINKYIKHQHLVIINIESIFDSQIWIKLDHNRTEHINDQTVIGFRIFVQRIPDRIEMV